MGMIDKKKLFKKGAPKREKVTVPGLEEPLIVAGLSAAQRGDLFLKCFDGKGKPKKGTYFAAEIVCVCVVDDDGNRVFDDGDIKDIGGMASEFLDPLFEAAQRLSGLTPESSDDSEKN